MSSCMSARRTLPFGGVGPSGMGSYHGIEGFRTFSHAKSIYRQTRIDVGKLSGLLPPYGKATEKSIRMQLKIIPAKPAGTGACALVPAGLDCDQCSHNLELFRSPIVYDLGRNEIDSRRVEGGCGSSGAVQWKWLVRPHGCRRARCVTQTRARSNCRWCPGN